MEIRKILVPLSGRHELGDPASLDAPALATAAKLGFKLGALVEALSVVRPPAPESAWVDWIPDFGMDMVLEGLAKQAEARRRNALDCYQSALQAHSQVRSAFVERQGNIRASVAAAGRLSDLIVVASSKSLWEMPSRPILEAALRDTARPIFVTASAVGGIAEHIAIAWNDTAAAARALVGSMPLLRIARSVTVLTCNENGRSFDPEPVVAYLKLHGITATGSEVVAKQRRPEGEIIDAAVQLDSDLLVLGSVIHWRTHHLVYGSLTEEVLKAPRLCALLVS